MQTPAQTDNPGWRIWFDGSAAPNPGRIGLGFIIESPDGTRTEKSVSTGKHGCNNEAELLAVHAAMELANSLGVRHLQVFGDSKAVIDFINGDDTTKTIRLQVLVDAVRLLTSAFEEIEIIWQPRRHNLEADRLSREALGLANKGTGNEKTRKRRRHKRK